MPMLSFSVPSMLPYIVNGLWNTQGLELAGGFQDWYSAQCERQAVKASIQLAPDRQKRQTIRPRNAGKKSAWETAKPGASLYVWWKQRDARERFFIGTVPLLSIESVSYRSDGAFRRGPRGTAAPMHIAPEPWHEDGFESLGEFQEYFGPSADAAPGGIFHGWEIKW